MLADILNLWALIFNIEIFYTHQHDDSPGAENKAAERADWSTQTEHNSPHSFASTRHDLIVLKKNAKFDNKHVNKEVGIKNYPTHSQKTYSKG